MWVQVPDDWPPESWAELDRELEANGLWARRHGKFLHIPNVQDDRSVHEALNPDLVLAEVLEAMGEK